MSVLIENTSSNQSVPVIKGADTIEVPYEIALENFKLFSNLLVDQWIYTDLSTKRITQWGGFWSYIYNPDPSLPLIRASAETLLRVINSEEAEDRVRKALLFDLHQRMAEGLERVCKTFEKPRPKIAQELQDLLTAWNGSKPTETQARQAKIFLIRRPVSAPSRAEVVSALKDSPVFQKKQQEIVAVATREFPARPEPQPELTPQQQWEINRASGNVKVNPSPLAKKHSSAMNDSHRAIAQAIAGAAVSKAKRVEGGYMTRRAESHMPSSAAKREFKQAQPARKTSYQEDPFFRDKIAARRAEIDKSVEEVREEVKEKKD